LNFDKDGDGKIDLIENDFNKLFTKNQKRVIEIDKSYIHQFVKISNYIKTKKQNTQTIFESIRDTSSQEELEERVNLLKNQIHVYELLVFHSINMIGALVSEDLIAFFDKL
jgi:predicted AAA+ superfamily ATPase